MRLDAGVRAGDDRHAAVVGIGDDAHRLVGGGAEQERGDAVDAGIDRAGEHGVLAVGRAFERDDLDLVAGRNELLVVVDGDAVDELQRPDAQDLVLGLRLRRRQGEPGCGQARQTAAVVSGRRADTMVTP